MAGWGVERCLLIFVNTVTSYSISFLWKYRIPKDITLSITGLKQKVLSLFYFNSKPGNKSLLVIVD